MMLTGAVFSCPSASTELELQALPHRPASRARRRLAAGGWGRARCVSIPLEPRVDAWKEGACTLQPWLPIPAPLGLCRRWPPHQQPRLDRIHSLWNG